MFDRLVSADLIVGKEIAELSRETVPHELAIG
jgi:hypothetical protein